MSGRRGGGDRKPERRPAVDEDFQRILAAHARVVLEVASQMGVSWEDAFEACPAVFDREAAALMERIARKRR